MKVKKKWKRYVRQIALACLLICYIAACVPQTVEAEMQSDRRQSINSFSINYVNSDKKDCVAKYTLSGSSPVYLWGNLDNHNNVLYCFMSKDKFTLKYDVYVEGKLYSSSEPTVSTTGCDHFKFYDVYITFPTRRPPVTAYIMSMDKGHELHEKDPIKYDMFNSHFQGYFLNNEQIPEYIECEMGDDSEGGVNNPILDSDIGCLVISKKKEADTSGLGDEGNLSHKTNLFRVRFGWKYKTTTGFSLKNNKYAQTFIQVRIQNRSVVYKNLTHKDIKYKLDSYGESAMLYKSLGIDAQPLRITLSDSDFLKKYLPRYYDEINSVKMLNNTLYLGNKYAFQFRVVCTDDLSVIPDGGGNSKWHCGRWTEVTSDFDPVTPNDDEQKTGELDDNGDFIQKDDDTTTKIDDSSSKQYDDDDEAEDDFNNSSKNDKNDKFGWDDFKNLINECKQVPGLIKSVFSFLPDWVLVFVGLAFGIWLFVLVKRAVI